MSYQAFADVMDETVTAAKLDRIQDTKARLITSLLVDALAPTNFLPTNPAALKVALETGVRASRGTRNFVDDLLHNGGRPRQVDTSKFVFGQNLAATPGKVVYRNDLMELLQYPPQTPQVHAAPLLCSPPWINKYYVMDLRPGRSFIEWAVTARAHRVRDQLPQPVADMSGVTMDDYLIHGPRQALDVIGRSPARETDIVGLCLGGALTAITAAYLAATGETGSARSRCSTRCSTTPSRACWPRSPTWTRSAAGEENGQGGRPGREAMAGTFDVLRANDLIFNYVVSNWLMGQDPPAFDILAWNADSTRMPAAMHAFYLRNFYVENRLAQDQLTLAGKLISSATSSTRPISWAPRTTTSCRGSPPTPPPGCCRADALCPVQRRSHRRHRQPARSQGLVRGGL